MKIIWTRIPQILVCLLILFMIFTPLSVAATNYWPILPMLTQLPPSCMKLKSKSITRWNNISYVLLSNLKCWDFLKDIVKHYPTKFIKEAPPTQKTDPCLLSKCSCDFVCESIHSAYGLEGDDFEFCELKADKIKSGIILNLTPILLLKWSRSNSAMR